MLMKRKKRRPIFFRYRGCDAFAAYLSRESMRGWHFKEFRFGMVFEAGEPQKRKYNVEVFPKGQEMDLRPESEAQEYALYCEAAGWKLVDSIRKFCVFEQVSDNAAAIVTPQERLANVSKAEWQVWFRRFFTYLMQFLLLYVNLASSKIGIFEPVVLTLCLWVLLLFAIELLSGVGLLADIHRKRRQLAAGQTPVYRHGYSYQQLLEVLTDLLAVWLLADFGYRQPGTSAFWIVGLYLAVIAALQVLPAFLRPGRAGYQAALFGAGVFLPVFVLAAVFAGPKGSGPSGRALDKVPFTLWDLVQPEGELRWQDSGISENFLGRMVYCHMESGPSSPSDGLSVLTYYLYESPYPWVISWIWEQEYKGRKDGWQACSPQWQAQQGSVSDGTSYLIRYEGQVLNLFTNRPLNQPQIRIIREKMEASEYGKGTVPDVDRAHVLHPDGVAG